MADNMVNSLAFSKLNGDNWRHWKFIMEMLCYEGLFGFIEGTEEEPTGDKTEIEKLNRIIRTVGQRIAYRNSVPIFTRKGEDQASKNNIASEIDKVAECLNKNHTVLNALGELPKDYGLN
ncbi:hypothetical protein AVEN_14108-1 [Araneus ventricosus]|uniref:DUF4219 domain-containing protein n=1 Tax=Araneus ventricosus TaxID=182803 RepID=A0A4Y2TMT7_ARAVE|nr:hypothetical protein AVEN_14108-1 [Araneus ventricosus]